MAKKKSVKAAYIAEQSRKRARSESTSSEHTSDSGREQKTGSPITSGSPSVDGAKKKRKLKGKSTIALFQLLLESSNRVVVLLSFSLSNKYSGGCTFFSLLLFPKQPPRNSTAAVRHGQRNTPRKKEEKRGPTCSCTLFVHRHKLTIFSFPIQFNCPLLSIFLFFHLLRTAHVPVPPLSCRTTVCRSFGFVVPHETSPRCCHTAVQQNQKWKRKEHETKNAEKEKGKST